MSQNIYVLAISSLGESAGVPLFSISSWKDGKRKDLIARFAKESRSNFQVLINCYWVVVIGWRRLMETHNIGYK